MFLQPPCRPGFQLFPDLFPGMVGGCDNDVAMVAATIHGMQRPVATFAMLPYDIFDQLTLLVIQKDR